MTAPAIPSATSQPSFAPADATRVAPHSIQQDLGPSAFDQLKATFQQIQRDPWGTVVGMVTNPLHDIKTALFSMTPEELANPQIQGRLRGMGVDPAKLAQTATTNQVLRASGRTLALAAGTGAGMATAEALGAATGLAQGAVKGTADAIAFGTTQGLLTPVEQGQTRAGNVLVSTLFSIPFAVVGGVTSAAIRRSVISEGIKPSLDAPEIAVTPKDFDPVADAHAEPPRNIPVVRSSAQVPDVPPQVTDATAPQTAKDAVAQVMKGISVGEEVKKPPITGASIYTALLDDLHPINVATTELLKLREQVPPGTAIATTDGPPLPPAPPSLTAGARLPGLDDPYVLARLARDATAKGTQFIEQGPLDWKTLQPVGKGLADIWQPVAGKLDELRAFLVAPRTLQLAQRGIETPIDAMAAKRVAQTATPDIMQAGLDSFKYNDQVLQYATDAGLFSPVAAEAMRAANTHYVPLWRFIENPEEGPVRGGGQRLVNVSPGVEKIKGGALQLKVNDPLENIVKNTYALVQAADRHAAGEALVRLAETVPGQEIVRPVDPPKANANAGVAVELRTKMAEAGIRIDDGLAQELADRFQPSSGQQEGTFWVTRDGMKKYYQVDAPLYRSLLGLDRESQNALIRWMSVPAQIEKAGLTAFSPTFPLRNPIRDQFTAAVFSRYGVDVPGIGFLRGLFSVLGRDKMFEEFARSGGEHAVIARSLGSDRAATQQHVTDILNHPDNPISWAWRYAKSPVGWLEALRRVSEVGEHATRSREFAKGLAQTADPRIAGFAAREVTIDFQRIGYAMRAANQVIPFLNPSLQDLDKMVRTFGMEGGKRSASATAKAVATITLPTLALYLANRGDPNYNELSDARRDFFWNVPLWRFNDEQGGYERSGKFLTVPKPFLLGLAFGSAPERAMRWIDQKDPTAFDDLAKNLFSAAMPPLMPAALTPIIEGVSNYDFFRNRPIVPDAEQKLLAQEQAGPLQGETVRAIGSALKVSPRLVEHFIAGYTGGAGAMALSVSDVALRHVGIVRPGGPPAGAAGVPGADAMLRAFVVDEPTVSSKSVERFYRRWTDITATMSTVRELARTPGRAQSATALAQTSPAQMAAYAVYAPTEKAIADLRSGINSLRGNTGLAQADKEQKILLLGRTIRTLAQKANEAFDRINAATALRPDQPPASVPGVTVTPR